MPHIDGSERARNRSEDINFFNFFFIYFFGFSGNSQEVSQK